MTIGELVDLIEKDYSGLLSRFDCTIFNVFFVDELCRLLILHHLISGLHCHAAGALLAAVHTGEHTLQLAGHFLQPGGRHDFDASGWLGYLDFD